MVRLYTAVYCERLVSRPPTFQHGDVHGIVGPLGDAQHHLQPILDLPLPFLTAGQQLLGEKECGSGGQNSGSNLTKSQTYPTQ